MEGENSPFRVYCPTSSYYPRENGEARHHEYDWAFKVKIDGQKPAEEMTSDEISRWVCEQVREATAFNYVGMLESAFMTAPEQNEAVPHVNFRYDIMPVRHFQQETRHQPFLTEFDLTGELSVDTACPVSEDEGWLLAKDKVTQQVAEKITQFILDNVDHKEKNGE